MRHPGALAAAWAVIGTGLLAASAVGEEGWARHMRLMAILFLALAAGCAALVLYRR